MVGVGNIVSVGGFGTGGAGGGSGIQVINPGNNTGPIVEVKGVNGLTITAPSPNCLVFDAGGASGVSGGGSVSGCFVEDFGPTTSGQFQHNFGTRNILVQILDNSSPPRLIFPDAIIYDTLDFFSVLFNRPQTGTIVASKCGTVCTGGSTVSKYAAPFSNITNMTFTHGLGTEDVIVQVYDTNKQVILPDAIVVENSNQISVSFNRPQSGRVVVI